ncbi:MAG: hypothetical protein ABR611_13830 [Chthoniobacterales bacterium]
MPAFEHLSVLASIIVGLAVSQVLFGLGQLVRRRGSYKPDVLYLLCNAIILLTLVDSWWAVFSWHDASNWSYRMTWFVLLNPLLVTTAAQLLPPDWDEKPIDLSRAFYRNHRLFFGLLACYPVIDIIDSALKGMTHFKSLGPSYPTSCLSMALLCLVAALTRSRKVQLVCSVGILLVVFSWIFEVLAFVPMNGPKG